jgi:CheY-like chemotaxis protein
MNPRRHRPRVVIGEEDDALRSDLCDLVSRLPIDVVPVASGSELVVLLTDPNSVDLVITDVKLPWMSGIHVAITARRSGLDMPIILMTPSPNCELREKTRRLCNVVLVALPVQPGKLLEIVHEQLFAPNGPENPQGKPLSMRSHPLLH